MSKNYIAVFVTLDAGDIQVIRQIVIDTTTLAAALDSIDNVPSDFTGVLINGDNAVTIGRDDIIDMKWGNS